MDTKRPISLNQACDTIHLFLEKNENIVNYYELTNALNLLWNSEKGEGKITVGFNSCLRHRIIDKFYNGNGGVNDLLQKIGFKQKVRK